MGITNRTTNDNNGGSGSGNFRGPWSAATNTPPLPNPPTAPDYAIGDYYQNTDAGTQFGINFAAGDLCKVVQDGAGLAWAKETTDLSGNGSGITNLNASALSTGTVPDARLSSNVALLDSENIFSKPQGYIPELVIDVAGEVQWDAYNQPSIYADLVDDLTINNFADSPYLEGGFFSIGFNSPSASSYTVTWGNKYKFNGSDPVIATEAGAYTTILFQAKEGSFYWVNTSSNVSVNGIPGPNITLTKSDIGLGNVPNLDTSDAANILSGLLAAARLPNAIPATKIANGSVSDAEFECLDGASSALQPQINTKAPLASPAFTGTPTAPTPSNGDSSTNIATTQFVAGTKLNQLSAPNADVSFGGYKLTNLADPASAQDAASKAYVDAIAQGLSPKTSCLYTTTGNISLVGLNTQANGTWSSTLNTSDRILVKDQTAPEENGIYNPGAVSWTRTTDADTWAELVGAWTFVTSGSSLSGSGWATTIAAGGTLGTTPVTWTQVNSAQVYTGSNGVQVSGTVISLIDTGVTPDSYGNVATTPFITVDSTGRITAISDNAIAIDLSQVTDAGTMAAQDASSVAITGGSVKNIDLTEQALSATMSGAYSINTAKALTLLSVTASDAITFPLLTAGQIKTIKLVLTNDSSSRTVTFVNVTWEKGVTPTIDTAANGVTYLEFTYDGSSTWIGRQDYTGTLGSQNKNTVDITGGTIAGATITSSTIGSTNNIDGAAITSGTISNSRLNSNIAKIDANTAWTAQLGNSIATLTIGNFMTWNLNTGQTAELSLTQNVTGLSFSNAVKGNIYKLILKQDGTGGRTVGFSSNFKNGIISAPINTTANAYTILEYVAVSTTELYLIAYNRTF